jgi:hypothetical protein
MAVEVFANDSIGTVTSGGTTAPTAGTVESWTVTPSIAFAVAVSGTSQFYIADTASGKTTEKMLVTVCPGGTSAGQTWSVTRGADGTATVTHSSGFTIQQVVSHASLANFAQLVSQALFTSSVVTGVVAVTFSTSITIDASLGNHFATTLTNNTTMNAPSNPTDGQKITFELTQDATGGRTVTWNSVFDFGTIGAPTLSALSKTDLIGFVYSARLTKWMYAGGGGQGL